MMNFKPSAWWFGLVPLLRGPLISVPAVIATDQPGVNLALMLQVLLVCYTFQLWFLPWKAPILNLVDALSCCMLLVLLAVSLHLEPASEHSMDLLAILGVGFYFASIILIGLVFSIALILSLLHWWKCIQSTRSDIVLNLGRLPDPGTMLDDILDLGLSVEEKSSKELDLLAKKMSSRMSTYDLESVNIAINILRNDLLLTDEKSCSLRSQTTLTSRVANVRSIRHSGEKRSTRQSLKYFESEEEEALAEVPEVEGSSEDFHEKNERKGEIHQWPLDDLDEEIKDEVCECDNEVDRKRVRL
eukprot:symbB.v1.2.017916.t1/scaffold1409.1/size120616/1